MITRRDSLIATIAIALTAALMALAQSAARPWMHSGTFNWSDFKAEPTKSGERRECFDAATATLERLECHVTTLNPGEVPHAPHQHPEEELVIVKQGVLEAMQNHKTNRVEAGGLIFEASNEFHGLRNIGASQAVYYVVKFYPRDLPKTDAK